MVWLYFISVYGLPLFMMIYAYAMEPKKSVGNTGVRL